MCSLVSIRNVFIQINKGKQISLTAEFKVFIGNTFAHVTLKALYPYLQAVGLVLLPHSLRSRAISIMIPPSLVSSLMRCFLVFVGRSSGSGRRWSPLVYAVHSGECELRRLLGTPSSSGRVSSGHDDTPNITVLHTCSDICCCFETSVSQELVDKSERLAAS